MTRFHEPETVIVGAGPVGTLLALLLAERGHEVTMYEGRPDPHHVPPAPGRSINLTLAERGWRALRAAGIEAGVRDICMPLYGRMIHDESGSSAFQPYTSRRHAIFSASREQLTARLLEEARSHPKVRIRFQQRCLEPDLDRRLVRFAGPGQKITTIAPARVFAADGAWSTLRRGLLRQSGASLLQRFSPTLYRELRLEHDERIGRLSDSSALHLWPRDECMIAGFPNLDGSLTLSVFMPLLGERSFASLTTPEQLETFLGDHCPDLLKASPRIVQNFFNVPPSLLVSSSCRPWVHDDWLALVGDAAHALVPFLGQGLNAGFEDCTVLMQCIDRHGDSWKAVLHEYQEARWENCETVIELAEQHYKELAVKARDPMFRVRKWLEEKVHRLAPARFVSLYTMVAFTDRAYVDVRRLQSRQEDMLDRLMRHPAIRAQEEGPHVDQLIHAELVRL